MVIKGLSYFALLVVNLSETIIDLQLGILVVISPGILKGFAKESFCFVEILEIEADSAHAHHGGTLQPISPRITASNPLQWINKYHLVVKVEGPIIILKKVAQIGSQADNEGQKQQLIIINAQVHQLIDIYFTQSGTFEDVFEFRILAIRTICAFCHLNIDYFLDGN